MGPTILGLLQRFRLRRFVRSALLTRSMLLRGERWLSPKGSPYLLQSVYLECHWRWHQLQVED